MKDLKKKIQSAVDVYKTGDLTKAESLCKKLIEDNPKVDFLYNLLGLIFAGQGNIQAAIEYYNKAIKINPNFAMPYNNLGLLYANNKIDYKKAENFYKKSISLDPKILEAQNNLGALFITLNKFEEAIDCYKKAILINPRIEYIHHNIANVYLAIGDFVKAKTHFKESIEINPTYSNSHRSLSRLVKYTDKEEHFNILKNLYKNTEVNDTANKINITFALGKAYEDVKDFDKSFSCYKEANEICREKIDFSLKKEKEKFEEIKKIYNKKLFDKHKNNDHLNYSPVFIIGMPRSCTTLVEQILSSHPNVFGADEVEFIPLLIEKNFLGKNSRLLIKKIIEFDNTLLKKIGEEYINKMRAISDNSDRTTDKLPINFLYVGFIKLILPNSKIINCYRNSKDNCLSIFKNQFSSGKIKFAYNMNEIVEYYNIYIDLMKHWKNLLPDFVYDLNYETLVSNTKIEVEKLLRYCNLSWNNDCLNFHNNRRLVKTASDIQVRNKIYRSSIDSWKNYEKYLNDYFVKLKN